MAETGIIRAIGGIIAQVTVEERHHDETMITSHPIENGAPVSDHAYDLPATLTVVVGWSNSSKARLIDDTGALNYVRAVYNRLLEVKVAKQPIAVTTAKRSYKNMMIQSIDAITNAGTENALLVTMVLKQVFLVETKIVQMPKPDVQADASQTGGTQQRGTQQLKPANDVQPPAQVAEAQ